MEEGPDMPRTPAAARIGLGYISDRHEQTCGADAGPYGSTCHELISHEPGTKYAHDYEPVCITDWQAWPCDAHILLEEVIRLRTVTV